ncbi:hypothetical protein KY284_019955 [Solanum tuberosum]|nr:hypothetical protein KY284_019955 [Solanum tuberosum]
MRQLLKELCKQGPRHQFNARGKGRKQKFMKSYVTSIEAAATDSNSSNDNKGGKYPPCQHFWKRNHPHFKCWKKPDMRCRKCHKLVMLRLFEKKKDHNN